MILSTGYSSLSYLHTLPIDALKLDQAFIRHMSDNGEHGATVQAVITLAMNRGIEVIAEGVETAGQLAQLQALDCELGQGYYFSRPLDVEKMAILLSSGSSWVEECLIVCGINCKNKTPAKNAGVFYLKI